MERKTNKSLKIGILTFQFSDNFGASLQMYALFSFLKNLGFDVTVVNYLPLEMVQIVSQSYKNLGFDFKRIVKRTIERKLNRQHLIKFNEFVNENIILSNKINSQNELINVSNNYDIIIVGSDQVWNPLITKKYYDSYLMNNFKCNKISYAASFGRNIDTNYIEKIREALLSFGSISIREKESCINLNNYITPKVAYPVVDPVFLLDRNYWNDFALKYKEIKEDYILIYMLENNDEILRTASIYAKEKNLKIYSVENRSYRRFQNYRNIKKLHDVGPNEFVWLLKNAKIVFTNSFHATAFSIIFKKYLLSFAHSSLNLRINNILSIYGLEGVQINHRLDDLKIIDAIIAKEEKNYNCFDNKLIKEINNSKVFLLDAINKIMEVDGNNNEQ